MSFSAARNTSLLFALRRKLFLIYRVTVITLFLLNYIGVTLAQDAATEFKDTVYDAPFIHYVSVFPQQNVKQKAGFFKWLGEWIVGKKEAPALIRPISILAANPDSFFIVDQGNRIILNVENNKSALLKCFKKNKSIFSSLVGICLLPGNEILFTDSRQNKIFSYSTTKNELKDLNDSLVLMQPTGIAYCAETNEIWVVETGLHRITVLDRQGNVIKTIGQRGEDQGEFNFPTFIWIDNVGDVYINDAMNFRIQIFNKYGKFISSFGKAGDATGYFASSKGIATDSHQNIYVVDALFHTVQIFDRQGRFLNNFGQQGSKKEQFWMPSGIYIDNKDFIYIADSYNSRIQIFQLKNNQ